MLKIESGPARYRDSLPQLSNRLFLSDGGIETTLLFKEGWELPEFAAFDLLKSEEGTKALLNYYLPFVRIALEHQAGFVLETPTWRASKDWGKRLGYSADAISALNRRSVDLMRHLRDQHETPLSPFVVSGAVGPRGDGYVADQLMTVPEAATYHSSQLEAFANAGADMASAITMTNVAEATGLAVAASKLGLPIAISFTVETDGRLPSGETLGFAIEAVDDATGGAPAYYMINCAHPNHFEHVVKDNSDWTTRIRGVRANASRCSHAELDEATELDDGDPIELGDLYRGLFDHLPNVVVLGGCCGTDDRHIAEIAKRCAPRFSAA